MSVRTIQACKFGNACGRVDCFHGHAPGDECKKGLSCIGSCSLRHIGRIDAECYHGAKCWHIGFCRYKHSNELTLSKAKYVAVHPGSYQKIGYDEATNTHYVDAEDMCDHQALRCSGWCTK